MNENRFRTKRFHYFHLIFLLIILILYALFAFFGADGQPNITPSTVNREALPHTAAVTDYLTVEDDWIVDTKYSNESMMRFYERTGVAPYLYILSPDNPLTDSEISGFADNFLSSFPPEENRFLIMFRDNGAPSYDLVLKRSDQAKAFMDEEACTIFREYVNYYFTGGKTPYYLVFSRALDKTCDRILNADSGSPFLLPVLILIIVAAAALVFKILYDKRIIFKNRKSKSL